MSNPRAAQNPDNPPAPIPDFFPPELKATFVNATDRAVHVRYWENDKYLFYGSLQKKTFRPLITYYGHRWTFHDSEDGELLTTNYFSPEEDDDQTSYVARLPKSHKSGTPSPQQTVIIKRKRHSLSYLALKAAASKLTTENVKELPVPGNVKAALVAYLTKKDAFLREAERDVNEQQQR